MPDTGAPWNIPYVAGTDLVADWPTDNQAQAEAIADALDVAGGLVAVKHAVFAGTQTNSTASGGEFAVTDLSIAHTMADAANKLIVSAYLGAASNQADYGNVGLAVADDGTLINIGTTAGNRASVTAGGWVTGATDNRIVTMPSVTFVYEPGDTAEHTYTVRAINIDNSTQIVYVNRSRDDSDSASRPRATSGLVIQEVRV